MRVKSSLRSQNFCISCPESCEKVHTSRSATMSKAFLSHHEHHSYGKGNRSMAMISASSVDATNADDVCSNASTEPNDFLIKVPPTSNRRQAASGLRERFQSSRRKPHEHQSISFKRGDSGPVISPRGAWILDTTCPLYL